MDALAEARTPAGRAALPGIDTSRADIIVLGLHQLIEFHIQIQRARIASLVPWLVIMHWLQINAHWWLSSAD